MGMLANGMHSLMLEKICEFMGNNKTKDHKTEFNWNVVIGEISPKDNN
jgi:hypothetical protein